MTSAGGSSDAGTIFKIGDRRHGLQPAALLCRRRQRRSLIPYGSLIQSGSTLYGMTKWHGGSGGGTIFKIGTDGTGFSLLHSFTGGASDGAYPYGSLIQSGSTLYGMTSAGGQQRRRHDLPVGTDRHGFQPAALVYRRRRRRTHP